jgi:flagellar hook-associated protein 1 FlgK
MGASPLISLGLKAMSASYSAMQTTGHNIANAGVTGYSRQETEFATAKGQFTGAGFFGKGVDVKTVSRAHDAFVTRAAATAKSLAAMDAEQQDRLEQLQQVFPTGEAGVGYTISGFVNALVDLASRPGDMATRQVVLARSQDLATRFNSAGTQIDTLQANVTADLRTSVSTVNGLTAAIAQVNDQVAASRGLGQTPNDLLDERERLVSELSGLVQVSTVQADDGTLSVFIGGGQRLVLGNQATELAITTDPEDSTRSALGLVDSGVVRVLEDSVLGGGSIAGLLNFQNEDLVDGRNMLGQLAMAISGAVNAQQRLGLNMQPPLGTVAAQDLFSAGTPRVVPNNNNAKDALGNFVSSVGLTVVDTAAVQAADYELRLDPAGSGQYQLTRRSDPELVRLVNSGDVVDGMQITIGSPAPALTDRFLLQPVNNAASGMRLLLQDPLDLAAASPLVATVSASNSGSAAVASLQMLTAAPQPTATAQITFTTDNGDYAWTLFDSANNVIGSGTGVWTADNPIPTPPNDINGFALNLSGVPRNGDVIDIAPTSAANIASNNSNALALAALRDERFVGKTVLSTGEEVAGSTATDAYAMALSDIGVRVQTATSSATISGAVAAQAEASRSEISGVNLDEEAARLIQYQQSYQAAAKVLQIAQSVFETLLQTATG